MWAPPETKFLIADILDGITQAQIWDLMLKNIKLWNLWMLVVTHSMDLAACICSKVLRFEELSAKKQERVLLMNKHAAADEVIHTEFLKMIMSLEQHSSFFRT